MTWLVVILLTYVLVIPSVALVAYGLGLKTGLDERRRFTFGERARAREYVLGPYASERMGGHQ